EYSGYAEAFEWDVGEGVKQGGYFVGLRGERIVIAKDGDMVIGVTCCEVGLVTGAGELHWMGTNRHDEVGAPMVVDNYSLPFEHTLLELGVDAKLRGVGRAELMTEAIGILAK